MVLLAEAATVPQPHAVVDVAAEGQVALQALSVQASASEHPVVANLDQISDRKLDATPSGHEAEDELRDLLVAVTWPRLGKLPHRVVIGVAVLDASDLRQDLRWGRAPCAERL